jgi:hypothetical protein
VRRHLLSLIEAGVLEKTSDYRPRFYLRHDGPADEPDE